jgi:hypothetical protein
MSKEMWYENSVLCIYLMAMLENGVKKESKVEKNYIANATFIK